MKNRDTNRALRIQDIVDIALIEDIGLGDVTTMATVNRKTKGVAEIIARENLTVAGIMVAEAVFKTIDKTTDFKALMPDGSLAKKNSTIARVSGRLSAMLTGERVALNLLQRLCGIATLTRQFVNEVKGLKVKILDTRKTTPGLRILEKYAVRVGGAFNHRFNLWDGILIKDNHIEAACGMREAVLRARKNAPKNMLIEVEAKSLHDVKEAVTAGADIVMLDNMKPALMKKAVRLIGDRALIEASGGVNLNNIREAAKTGVDFISIGALTHSARAVDISMEITKSGRKHK